MPPTRLPLRPVRVTPGRRRRRRARSGTLCAALTTVVVAGLVAGPAAPATAHDQLLSTDPADGSTLEVAPTAVTLLFSEDVLDISTIVVVAGPAGDVPVQVAVDGATVTATLTGDQPDGAYDVTWRIVSSDGHPVQGAFDYALAAPAPSPAPTAGETTGETTAPTAGEPATAAPGPTPTPTPAPGPSATASTGGRTSPRTAVLVVALAVLAAALAAAAALWARHRTPRSTR